MKPFYFLIILSIYFYQLNLAQADGGCDEAEIHKSRMEFKAKLSSLPKDSDEALVLHANRIRSECVDSQAIEESTAAIKSINLNLAKKAEKDGNFYSLTKTSESAFSRYENAGDFKNANRVGLLALKKNPRDIMQMKALIAATKSYEREKLQFSSDDILQAIEKLAKENSDRVLADEANLAKELRENDLSKMAMLIPQSLKLLEEAADFLSLTKSGDTQTKKIAEKRGDDLSKDTKSHIHLGFASSYYKYAGSKKASKLEAALAEQEKTMKNVGKEMEKAFEGKSKEDADKFKKGADDLEDELGI